MRQITRKLLPLTMVSLLSYPLFAKDEKKSEKKDEKKTEKVDSKEDKKAADEMEAMRQASSTQVRRFHEVLDELLAEFGYDVKQGQIKDLKNVAVRKVEVSEALPDTYKEYVKLLIAERIRENSDVKIINCVPCSSRTSRLVEGKIVITSPTTNQGELMLAANRLGIDNFMDVILVYHSTHMVLAFQVFKTDSNELIWARTYNSETIKSRYQKLAIDYQQIARSKPGEEYKPEYRLLIGLGAAGIPNVGGDDNDSSMLTLQFRSTEKFDNRRSEFGMLFSFYDTLSSLLKAYPEKEGTGTDEADPNVDAAIEEESSDFTNPAVPAPFKSALGIWGLYAHNFLGSVESYNEVRQGLHVGLGGLLATGYVAGSGRLGWDIYFGRRFSMNFSGVYIAPSKIILGDELVPTAGGMGADVVLSFNY